jgi:hypothetical protein
MSFMRTWTSRSITHPQIAPRQAHLTLEFFGDEFSEKKLQFIGMSIVLILFSPGPGCLKLQPKISLPPKF